MSVEIDHNQLVNPKHLVVKLLP